MPVYFHGYFQYRYGYFRKFTREYCWSNKVSPRKSFNVGNQSQSCKIAGTFFVPMYVPLPAKLKYPAMELEGNTLIEIHTLYTVMFALIHHLDWLEKKHWLLSFLTVNVNKSCQLWPIMTVTVRVERLSCQTPSHIVRKLTGLRSFCSKMLPWWVNWPISEIWKIWS